MGGPSGPMPCAQIAATWPQGIGPEGPATVRSSGGAGCFKQRAPIRSIFHRRRGEARRTRRSAK
ncbi:DUF6053 domain-containing protein [Lysobacter enzymogenes]|uniref:DUF6053 domain-containing protein n=1 Tax=Lysobacter enzymogenes TaxID=69 RepID=UPI003D18DFEB